MSMDGLALVLNNDCYIALIMICIKYGAKFLSSFYKSFVLLIINNLSGIMDSTDTSFSQPWAHNGPSS